jgi:hypothetical protein
MGAELKQRVMRWASGSAGRARSIHLLLVVLAMLSMSSASGAQEGGTAPRPFWRRVHLLAGIGGAFPSGGDFNDTYDPGGGAMLAASARVSRLVGVRAEVMYALYPPGSLQGRPILPGNGYTLGVTANATLTPPMLGRKLYVVGGGGFYEVYATWLRPDNTIETAKTQNAAGVNGGFGVRFGNRYFFEARRHTVFRKRQNNAGFISAMLGLRL